MRRDASIFTMDWRGRGTERDVKLHILSNRSAPRFLQWIGLVERLNATERVVKRHIVGGTRSPSQGFDRSKSAARGKVAQFSNREASRIDFYNGLAWSRD